MRLPGRNTLTLTSAAISEAIEDMLNAGRQPGEDRIRVLEFERRYTGEFIATVSTDQPAPIVIDIAEAA
jgi:hypothetical protein